MKISNFDMQLYSINFLKNLAKYQQHMPHFCASFSLVFPLYFGQKGTRDLGRKSWTFITKFSDWNRPKMTLKRCKITTRNGPKNARNWLPNWPKNARFFGRKHWHFYCKIGDKNLPENHPKRCKIMPGNGSKALIL